MKIMSYEKGEKWLSTYKLPTIDILYAKKRDQYHITYRISPEALSKTVDARNIAHSFIGEQHIVWILERDIWPTAENKYLIERFRSSFGNSSLIENTPVHLFDKSEEEISFSIISLALYFEYGFLVIGETGAVRFLANHESIMLIDTNDLNIYFDLEVKFYDRREKS